MHGLVDLDFFDAHGWVIVPSVVSAEAVQKVVGEIGALLRMDLSNRGECYTSRAT